VYSYNDLLADLPRFEKAGAEVSYIGASVTGRMIPAVHIGNYCGAQTVIQSAIHGREHITAKLAAMQIFHILQHFTKVPEAQGGIYFVPMSNPDGVSLCQFGLNSVKNSCRAKFLLNVNGGNPDFSLWKANANAVDLNCNFPARWGTGAENVFMPAPENFVGEYAASEPETKALMKFTEKVCPALTISYHCKGREIYWQFHQTGARLERDRRVAEVFANLTGYALVDGDRGSAGGYKDWCVECRGIPAVTIEIIDDKHKHPVPYGVLKDEFPLNKNIPKIALVLARML